MGPGRYSQPINALYADAMPQTYSADPMRPMSPAITDGQMMGADAAYTDYMGKQSAYDRDWLTPWAQLVGGGGQMALGALSAMAPRVGIPARIGGMSIGLGGLYPTVQGLHGISEPNAARRQYEKMMQYPAAPTGR